MGTATSLEGQPRVQPTGETFKAGVAFEGVGDSRTAITNIAMLGKVWKQLFKAYLGQEATYEQAAKEALICLKDNMERFDLSKLPEDSAEVVAFMDEVCGKGASNSFKLACFINSCAAACDQKLKATAEVLHLSRPTVVAIIGGWAENVAFRRALEMLGYKVQIPPLATLATHAGLAADALVRVGYAPSFAQALAMMISKA